MQSDKCLPKRRCWPELEVEAHGLRSEIYFGNRKNGFYWRMCWGRMRGKKEPKGRRMVKSRMILGLRDWVDSGSFLQEEEMWEVVGGKLRMLLSRLGFKYNRHSCRRGKLAVRYVDFIWPHKSVRYQLYIIVSKAIVWMWCSMREEKRAWDEFLKNTNI